MMGHRDKLKTGDEYDCVHKRVRRVYGPTAGVCKAIKNGINRRSRRVTKEQIRKDGVQ